VPLVVIVSLPSTGLAELSRQEEKRIEQTRKDENRETPKKV